MIHVVLHMVHTLVPFLDNPGGGDLLERILHKSAVLCMRMPCVQLLDICSIVSGQFVVRKLWYRLILLQRESIVLAAIVLHHYLW